MKNRQIRNACTQTHVFSDVVMFWDLIPEQHLESLQYCNDHDKLFLGPNNGTIPWLRGNPRRKNECHSRPMTNFALHCARIRREAKEETGRTVDPKSRPADIQHTIRKKAAAGEIVRVKREDNTNGKWNFEGVVKTNGKEWGIEVDPNGKFLRQQSAIKKQSGN
jgi:hypothetical protein